MERVGTPMPDEPGAEDGRIRSHPFQGVRGHPDDDECTFRRDGTDATYCGRPEHEHKESLR